MNDTFRPITNSAGWQPCLDLKVPVNLGGAKTLKP